MSNFMDAGANAPKGLHQAPGKRIAAQAADNGGDIERFFHRRSPQFRETGYSLQWS